LVYLADPRARVPAPSQPVQKKTRLTHSSQPGKVNFAWGVRLKRGAFGGQAKVNVGAT